MAKKKKSKKKKGSSLKNLLGILVLLVIIQGAVFFILGKDDTPKTAKDIINDAVNQSKTNDPRRREQMRVQLALIRFQSDNKGTLPETLSDLVPRYLDTSPIDPDTGQEFKFEVVDGKAIVGSLGEEKAGGTPAKGSSKGKKGKSKKGQDPVLAALEEREKQAAFIYDPYGKRDPFKPFNFGPQENLDPNKTPLERLSIGQLTLKAVLKGMGEPAAMVETDQGRGFTVRKGTKIGPNGGEVVEILKDKLLILETTTDFTGAKRTRTIEMKLHTSGQ